LIGRLRVLPGERRHAHREREPGDEGRDDGNVPRCHGVSPWRHLAALLESGHTLIYLRVVQAYEYDTPSELKSPPRRVKAPLLKANRSCCRRTGTAIVTPKRELCCSTVAATPLVVMRPPCQKFPSSATQNTGRIE